MDAASANVEIRLASPADAAMLARLRFDLRAATHDIRENEADFIERCTAWMQERLRGDGPWQCWIAESEAVPVGSVWVQLIEKIPNPIAEPESYVYLTNFYVRPEYRDEGIGSRLLAEALAWSRSKNAEAMILWPTERSKPLYMRHGFLPSSHFMELIL
jgi:GNAT superfamily N-acetyltransferase